MTSLNPVLSIGVQLTENMQHHLGLGKAEAEAKGIKLLELVGISEPGRRLKQYPHHLSGGMRQRVMIAMAIAARPRLLIADEAPSALDVTVQAAVLDTLDRLAEERGMAVLMITHDMGVVARFCDVVTVMYRGAVVEQGPTAEILTNPRHDYTRGLLAAVPRLRA